MNRIDDLARHRLSPLLNPRSIALVGASPRPGTVGSDMIRTLRSGGFQGAIQLVNPKYDTIDDLPCYPSLSALPAPVDMAVLSVASVRIEALLEQAMSGAARSATIFDACKVKGEGEPTLLHRMRERAAATGFPICGGNAMGFYNFNAGIHVSFQAPEPRKAGHIAFIAHSGSVFVLPTGNDRRFRFNLAVSAGQEIGATIADYMDYALEMPSTRAIAVFAEAIRDPAGFRAALGKANERNVPVAIAKVGRTERSARFAASHSGALAGNDAAFAALCDRYGAIRTRTLDDLLNTAMLASEARDIGAGGLGYVADSGGLRELIADIAEEERAPLAVLTALTVERLAKRLPHGLEPANPLDAAGPFTPDFEHVFRDCLRHVMADPNVAIGAFEFEARDAFVYKPAFVEIAKEVRAQSGKPLVVTNAFAMARNERLAEELLDANVPLINGVDTALRAIRDVMRRRNCMDRRDDPPPSAPNETIIEACRESLTEGCEVSEAAALELLRAFGVPATVAIFANGADDAVEAARAHGYPVVLKTAAPGIRHKSDRGGVRIALSSDDRVRAAHADIAAALGSKVIVTPMVSQGIETAFGMVVDPQFGPLVMVCAGGVLIETFRDRAFALAPFGPTEARRLIDSLAVRSLLDGVRGAPAVDIDALALALSRFSVLADALAGQIVEMDVNPVIARADGPIAVDALIAVGAAKNAAANDSEGGEGVSVAI